MIDRTTLRLIAHLSFLLKAVRERRAGTIQQPEVLALLDQHFVHYGGFVISLAPQSPF